MVFTGAQVAHFQEQGYVAVPDFWTAREAAAMQAETERLKREGLLRNVATEGDGRTQARSRANLQICPVSPKSEFFRAMPFAPKVVEAVGRLIGDPVLLRLDQIFLKPARHGAGTNWHQDNAYFQIPDPMQGVALWTAVHEATAANGTMRVIPGSFRTPYEHARDGDSDHHIRCYPPEEEAVLVELPAGGALFFAYGVAHATGANETDRERAGMALHFLTESAADAAHGMEGGTHPYLSGPEATGGLREYGVRVAGTWEAEVARLA